MGSFKQAEIVAPAGTEDMLYAAVRSGADAVYLSLPKFSARGAAQNFTIDRLVAAVGYCHARNVRVFVAVNTTVYNSELFSVAELLQQIAQSSADALIIQDMGVFNLAKVICPDMMFHASTQCGAITAAGAVFLSKSGFSRVVLGREASKDEVARAVATGVDIEVFVHGALCVSVSGNCYMSAFLGGRSANRGECASPCRLSYKTVNGVSAERLSLKDLSLIEDAFELSRMGVKALKIEGRMRTPEYAAVAVSSLYRSLHGEEYDRDLLHDIFSHGGFTKGYYAKSDNMLGARSGSDMSRTKVALPRAHELYRKERQSVGISLSLCLKGQELCITATAGDITVCRSCTVETQITQNDRTKALTTALSKTGGTPFFAEKIYLDIPPDVFIPTGIVSALRKELLLELTEKLETQSEGRYTEYTFNSIPVHHVPEKHRIRVRVQDIAQLEYLEPDMFEYVIIPADTVKYLPQRWLGKAIAELPRAMFDGDEAVKKIIGDVKDVGIDNFLVNNPAHIQLCKEEKLFGGFALNITNYLAAEHYNALGLLDITLSIELKTTEISGFSEITGVIGYGHLPFMLLRVCPLGGNCDTCKNPALVDRKNRRIDIICQNGGKELLNAVPIYMAERKRELATDFITLYFTTETAKRTLDVTRMFLEGKPFDGEFTRGLFY